MANAVEASLIVALGKTSGAGSFDPVIDAVKEIVLGKMGNLASGVAGVLDTSPLGGGSMATSAEDEQPGMVPGSPEAQVAEKIRRSLERRTDRADRVLHSRDRDFRVRDFETPSGRDTRSIA